MSFKDFTKALCKFVLKKYKMKWDRAEISDKFQSLGVVEGLLWADSWQMLVGIYRPLFYGSGDGVIEDVIKAPYFPKILSQIAFLPFFHVCSGMNA